MKRKPKGRQLGRLCSIEETGRIRPAQSSRRDTRGRRTRRILLRQKQPADPKTPPRDSHNHRPAGDRNWHGWVHYLPIPPLFYYIVAVYREQPSKHTRYIGWLLKLCNNLLCPDHLGVTVLEQTVPTEPRACEVTRAH